MLAIALMFIFKVTTVAYEPCEPSNSGPVGTTNVTWMECPYWIH